MAYLGWGLVLRIVLGIETVAVVVVVVVVVAVADESTYQRI